MLSKHERGTCTSGVAEFSDIVEESFHWHLNHAGKLFYYSHVCLMRDEICDIFFCKAAFFKIVVEPRIPYISLHKETHLAPQALRYRILSDEA